MEITRLRIAFVAITLVITALWLLSVPADVFGADFWSIRSAFILFTGLLSIGFMAVGVMLAARPVQIESLLGGLDKFYRLHKWLGIGAVLLAVGHWLLEVAPRWMIALGWLAPRQRRARGAAGDGQAASPLADLREAGAEVGEWGFYLLLLLTVLALWKRVPYHYFFRTHRLMALVYLMLVFHAVVLMPPEYWTAAIGPLLAVLMAGGSVAAVVSLFHRIGHARRAVGRVEYMKQYLGNAVLEVGVRCETKWPGHRAGQFAFVTFDPHEGAHPFTISSAWQDDGRLTFEIKGLGDYTRALPDLVEVGQPVTVEGPYGRFDFRSPQGRQVWVGGGIGITPFIARLQALAETEEDMPVDLIYSTQVPDEAFIDNIRALAAETGVRFHLWVTPEKGLLTLDWLEEVVPAWKEADVWFCGPEGFGRDLREAMTERGLAPRQFHQEMFAMR